MNKSIRKLLKKGECDIVHLDLKREFNPHKHGNIRSATVFEAVDVP